MRDTPNLLVERHRVRDGPLASSRFDGNNGAFTIPMPPIPAKGPLTFAWVVVSDQHGWEHVSVSIGIRDVGGEFRSGGRTPTWEEMDRIKRLFWKDDETVMQLHVPRTDHINDHPHVLHLWRPTHTLIPLPPSAFVGIGVEQEKLSTMTTEDVYQRAAALAQQQGVRDA